MLPLGRTLEASSVQVLTKHAGQRSCNGSSYLDITGGRNQTLLDLACCALFCRNLSQNAIGGSLPPEWGWERSFMQLVTLTLDGNRLSGQLPETYGRPGAWEALQALVVDNNQLTGGARCYHAHIRCSIVLERTSTSSLFW